MALQVWPSKSYISVPRGPRRFCPLRGANSNANEIIFVLVLCRIWGRSLMLSTRELFAFAFAFAPLTGRVCPGPRGTEVGGSEGQSLEFHALYINVIRRQTVCSYFS